MKNIARIALVVSAVALTPVSFAAGKKGGKKEEANCEVKGKKKHVKDEAACTKDGGKWLAAAAAPAAGGEAAPAGTEAPAAGETK